MKTMFRHTSLCIMLTLAFCTKFTVRTLAQTLDQNDPLGQYSIDGKIDVLAGSIDESDLAREYFVGLGPQVVPIVTTKLLRSLAEGSSQAADRQTHIIIEMPPVDQKRVRLQIGLIIMEGLALHRMSLSPDIRMAAIDGLYRALRSPYENSRRYALEAVGDNLGKEAIENILPLLKDREDSIRGIATDLLKKIGDASVADRIKTILDERRRGLTANEVNQDPTFRYGYEAIDVLRRKGMPEAK